MQDSHIEALTRTGVEETSEFEYFEDNFDPDDPEFQKEYNNILDDPLTDAQIEELLQEMFESDLVERVKHERHLR